MSGTHFPLTSRPAECPMPLAVRYGCPSVAAYPSLLTAGADIPEADTPQRIATDPSVIDAERDPLYGDRVPDGEWYCEDCGSLLPRYRSACAWCAYLDSPLGASTREEIRQGRLSRWQEQR